MAFWDEVLPVGGKNQKRSFWDAALPSSSGKDIAGSIAADQFFSQNQLGVQGSTQAIPDATTPSTAGIVKEAGQGVARGWIA